MGDVLFDPVDNALDYLASAAQHLGEDLEPGDLKYGILHLFAGVEVLAKAALLHRTQNWREVVRSDLRERVTEQQFAQGDFKSIGPFDALKRLRALGHSRLSVEDLAAIDELGKLRNRLQHFGMTEPGAAVTARSTPVLSAAIRLLNEAFDPDDFTKEQEQLLEQIRDATREFEDFTREHLTAVERTVDPSLTAIECPACGHMLLTIQGEGVARCAFCVQQRRTAEQLVGDHGVSMYEVVTRGAYDPVHECPECDELTLVEGVASSRFSEAYVCMTCGWQADLGDLSYCMSCGRPFRDRDVSAVCNSCFKEAVNRPD